MGTIKNIHTKNTQEGRGRELGATGKEGVRRRIDESGRWRHTLNLKNPVFSVLSVLIVLNNVLLHCFSNTSILSSSKISPRIPKTG
jgi:hypothetical protein